MGIYGPVIDGVVIPAGVCAVLSLAGRYWPRRSARPLFAVAPAAGFVAGFLALEGWPGFPPHDDWARILFVGVWCAVLAAVRASSGHLNRHDVWNAVWVATSGAVAWLLTPAWVDDRAFQMAALGASASAVWLVLDGAMARRSPVTGIAIGVLSASAVAAVLVLTGNAKLGLLAGSIAAVLFIQALIRLPAARIGGVVAGESAVTVQGIGSSGQHRGGGSGAGVATITGGLLPGLAYVGHFNNFSGVGWWVFALAAIAPAAAVVGDLPPFRTRGRPWSEVAVRLSAVVISCVVSVVGAARGYEPV
ncbi:MAG: hypothetical protein HOP29_00325 [Phycisphaerales bacterium]|nr:hypothetical protein [Phycisphaerales bacterium]